MYLSRRSTGFSAQADEPMDRLVAALAAQQAGHDRPGSPERPCICGAFRPSAGSRRPFQTDLDPAQGPALGRALAGYGRGRPRCLEPRAIRKPRIPAGGLAVDVRRHPGRHPDRCAGRIFLRLVRSDHHGHDGPLVGVSQPLAGTGHRHHPRPGPDKHHVCHRHHLHSSVRQIGARRSPVCQEEDYVLAARAVGCNRRTFCSPEFCPTA